MTEPADVVEITGPDVPPGEKSGSAGSDAAGSERWSAEALCEMSDSGWTGGKPGGAGGDGAESD